MERRITVVINEDPDTGTTSIRALGDHTLPAPIERPSRELEELMEDFKKGLLGWMAKDSKGATPWA